MFNLHKQKKIYTKLYAKHGHSIGSLHWRSRHTQKLRFDALLRLSPQNGQSILDIGCGFGDFFTYLDKRFCRQKYFGCEIVPDFASISQANHPEAEIFQSCYLKLGNLRPDLIFASGIFGFGDTAFFKNVCKKALRECRVGFAFNLCTDDNFNHITPDEAFTFLNRYASSVQVVEGYLENDVTFLAHPQIALRSQYQYQLSPVPSF